MNTAILSCYFTSAKDPQRGFAHPNNSIELMRTWYESARAKVPNAGLVVFHDGSISETTAAMFPECFFPAETPTTDFSLNDYRFIAYLLYLRERPQIDYVLTTDLFDVEFYQDPFAMMEQGKLYIGSNDVWREKPRQLPRLEALVGSVEDYLHRPLLNPGILGGERTVVLEFIRACLPKLGVQFNNNMPLVNLVGYSERWRDRIITGHPLHTKFKKYETIDSGTAIRHK